MSSIFSSFKKLRSKQSVVQAILLFHRQWALKRFLKILPKRYTQNRYKKTEHRNCYEVDRIWDEKLQLTIEYIDSVLPIFNFLKPLPGQILLSRYEQMKKFKNINSELCDEFIKRNFSESKLKILMEDIAAENKLDREHEFLILLFEMIDESERFIGKDQQ